MLELLIFKTCAFSRNCRKCYGCQLCSSSRWLLSLFIVSRSTPCMSFSGKTRRRFTSLVTMLIHLTHWTLNRGYHRHNHVCFISLAYMTSWYVILQQEKLFQWSHLTFLFWCSNIISAPGVRFPVEFWQLNRNLCRSSLYYKFPIVEPLYWNYTIT